MQLFYDLMAQRALSEAQMTERGFPLDDLDTLASLNIYPLTVETPDYDPATQGVEPDGLPAPAPDNPCAFVQHMHVFNLMERAKAQKKDAATAKRWEYETRGIITPDEITILTGTDDQNRIASAIQGMKNASMAETDFKAASGWTKVTLEQLEQIAALIAVHVQTCFSRERALHEQIDACETLEQLNAINLDEGWPTYDMTPPEDGGEGNTKAEDTVTDETAPAEDATPASPAPEGTPSAETTTDEGGGM